MGLEKDCGLLCLTVSAQCCGRWNYHLAYPDAETLRMGVILRRVVKEAPLIKRRGNEKDGGFYPANCSGCRQQRWHNHLVFLNVSCGEWSAEEETCLTTAVDQQEDKTKMFWKTVARFPGVNHSWEQCRVYWRNTLSPKINLEKPNGFKQPIMRRDDMFKNDGFDFLNKVLAMMEQEKKFFF